MDHFQEGSGKAPQRFSARVWTAAGIVALVVTLLWLVKATFSVLLLILAGALIALYFRGLSGLLHRGLHLPEKGSLSIAIMGSLLLVAGFFWLAGNRITQQASQLSEILPSTVEKVKEELRKSPVGQHILQKATSGRSMQKASAVMKTFFRSTFGVLGDVYVVLFLGIFFTVSPRTYIHGFLQLMPYTARPRAGDVVGKAGATLTKWLKGKIFSMLVVAVLTVIGLLIIGVPMAFVLALIAGLLNFIPNFGPLIAMVPAVLVGFLKGPSTALLVAGLYIGVQVLESNVITPQIQKRLINIPPALIIMAQLFMGVLTGGWGLVLATPLVAILMVVVQELWVKQQNLKT
ncbi:AI-2E family transporter [Paraflavisolibacter sp. H34]|uniref:AI-2E family transporter n=1 Tax=Huijunlia imazamoxiresistens TaxID=3127457 RepID=UPI00301AA0BF